MDECNAWSVNLLVEHASASARPPGEFHASSSQTSLRHHIDNLKNFRTADFSSPAPSSSMSQQLGALAPLDLDVAGNKVGAREQPLPRCLEPAHLGKERLGSTIHLFSRDTLSSNGQACRRHLHAHIQAFLCRRSCFDLRLLTIVHNHCDPY